MNRDEVLYRSGAKCEAVYAIQTGFFKTTLFSEDGRAQITGFPMSGDLLGLDAIGAGKNRCDAIALSQGEVCVIPRADLARLSHDSETLQAHVLRALCDQIGGNLSVMLLLRGTSAEERVVAFVIDLSERLLACGGSWSEFRLWMTRADIGSFLGLELETVSRIFSRLDEQGVLTVQGRHIRIRDLDALRKLIGQHDENSPRRRPRMRASFRSLLLDPAREHDVAHRLATRIIEHAAAMSEDIGTFSQASV